MVKNYIFDFGNVLAEFYPDKLTAPFVKNEDDRKCISEIVFDRLYWDRLDAGTITDDEAKLGMCSRLAPEYGNLACVTYDNWVRSLTPVPGMQQLVNDIKNNGSKLYLISNISLKFVNDYSEVKWIKELFELFDGLIFSAVIDKLKPNKDIFEYALKEYELKPSECLFVDDNEDNIKGAVSAGLNAYLFDGDAKNLRKYIGI